MSLNNSKLREHLCDLFDEMLEKKKSNGITQEYLQQVNSQTTLGNTILRTASNELEYNKFRDNKNKIDFFENN
jgi:hypothetical protein